MTASCLAAPLAPRYLPLVYSPQVRLSEVIAPLKHRVPRNNATSDFLNARSAKWGDDCAALSQRTSHVRLTVHVWA